VLGRTAKGGYSLRISLDSAYPGIIESARRAIAAVKGGALPPATPHPACACVVITSYQFSNRSDDIRRLFTDACDRIGVAWRPWGRFHVSIARCEAVATLDTFIGPKA
jgi:hypothetical protein